MWWNWWKNHNNVIPSNFWETKKLVAGLGLSRINIDYCIDEWMLYYKDHNNLKECKFCKKNSTYKTHNKKNSTCNLNLYLYQQ